jgi:hypothetical protein
LFPRSLSFSFPLSHHLIVFRVLNPLRPLYVPLCRVDVCLVSPVSRYHSLRTLPFPTVQYRAVSGCISIAFLRFHRHRCPPRSLVICGVPSSAKPSAYIPARRDGPSFASPLCAALVPLLFGCRDAAFVSRNLFSSQPLRTRALRWFPSFRLKRSGSRQCTVRRQFPKYRRFPPRGWTRWSRTRGTGEHQKHKSQYRKSSRARNERESLWVTSKSAIGSALTRRGIRAR